MPSAKKNRTKGNVKPSSSSGAAQLLAQSGTFRSSFLGFSSSGGVQPYVSSIQMSDDSDQCLDDNFRVVLRKLSKKDVTTKIKAMVEFQELCDGYKDGAVFPVLPFWPRLYNKLAMDPDHRVREHAQKAMQVVVSRVGKNLAPHLKAVIGSWILCCNDSYPTVASAAKRAFNSAFSSDKQQSVFVFCKHCILQHLMDTLTNQMSTSPTTNAKTTENEVMLVTVERLQCASLMGMRQLFLTLPPDQIDDSMKSCLRRLLGDSKFYGLAKPPMNAAKFAVFRFLSTVCQIFPEVAGQHSKKISSLVLTNIDTTEPGIVRPLWEAVLAVTNHIPDCWDDINWQKCFWPKLKKLLENGCYGNASTVAANLLPLFCRLPLEKAGGSDAFFPRVMALFPVGFLREAVLLSTSETNAWIRAFMECLRYAVTQCSKDDSEGVVMRSLVSDQLVTVVELSLCHQKLIHHHSLLYSLVGTFLRSTEDDSRLCCLPPIFWSRLTGVVLRGLEPVETGTEGAAVRPEMVVLLTKALCLPQPTVTEAENVGVWFHSAETTWSKTLPPPVTPLHIPSYAGQFFDAVIVRCVTAYLTGHQVTHLSLLADLVDVYFPPETAGRIFGALADSADTCHPRSGDLQQGQCAYVLVAEAFVLPMLAAVEFCPVPADPVVLDCSILLLFSCSRCASLEDRSHLWELVLQGVKHLGSLYCLLVRLLGQSDTLQWRSQWLASPCLYSKLQILLNSLLSSESDYQTPEVEDGWRIICLVLSTKHNDEPGFPCNWVSEIVRNIYNELLKLTQRSLSDNEALLTLKFAANGALTFLENMTSYPLDKQQHDVIIALLRIDLGSKFESAGDIGRVVRQCWKSGLSASLSRTDSPSGDGRVMMLSACASVITDTLLTKTTSLEQFDGTLGVTKEFIGIVCEQLNHGEQALTNPVVQGCLAEMIIPSSYHNFLPQITKHLCMDSGLELFHMEYVHNLDNDCLVPAISLVLLPLFNFQVYECFVLRLCSDNDSSMLKTDSDTSAPYMELMLDCAVSSLIAAEVLLKAEIEESCQLAYRVKQIKDRIHQCLLSASSDFLHHIFVKSLQNEKMDAMSKLATSALLNMVTSLDVLNDELLQHIFSDNLSQTNEFMVPFISEDNLLSLFEKEVTYLVDIGGEHLPDVSAKLRFLGVCMRWRKEVILRDGCHLLTSAVSSIRNFTKVDYSFFLYSCDVAEQPSWKVDANISMIHFLTTLVDSHAHHFLELPNVWDFTMCSAVLWTESVVMSHFSLASPVVVTAFSMAVFRFLDKLSTEVQLHLPLNRDLYPDCLQLEWNEFYTKDICSFIFPMSLEVLDELGAVSMGESKKLLAPVVVETLMEVVVHLPLEHVLEHKLPIYLQAGDTECPIPESVQTLLNRLCPSISSWVPSVQITVYLVLRKVMSCMSKYYKETSLTGTLISRFPPMAVTSVIEHCGTAIHTVLSDAVIEESITLRPGTEEYKLAVAYLLTWHLLLDFICTVSDRQLKTEFVAQLRQHWDVGTLLSTIFLFMPTTPASCPASSPVGGRLLCMKDVSEKRKSHRSVLSLDDLWLPMLLPTGSGVEPEDVGHLASCVYLTCLKVMPVLVRQWWKGEERKSAVRIDRITTQHISPLLVKAEMETVNQTRDIEGMQVKANPILRQVIATYSMEEKTTDLQIILPENYPLGEIQVQSERHVVIRQSQWTRYLLTLTVFLQHQNVGIIDSLKWWKHNIDKHLQGVEECYICYAVIHASTYKLPRTPCKTCRKKFHTDCLYKWLDSSANATCPLCRSEF